MVPNTLKDDLQSLQELVNDLKETKEKMSKDDGWFNKADIQFDATPDDPLICTIRTHCGKLVSQTTYRFISKNITSVIDSLVAISDSENDKFVELMERALNHYVDKVIEVEVANMISDAVQEAMNDNLASFHSQTPQIVTPDKRIIQPVSMEAPGHGKIVLPKSNL